MAVFALEIKQTASGGERKREKRKAKKKKKKVGRSFATDSAAHELGLYVPSW